MLLSFPITQDISCTYSKIDGHINVEMQEHIIQKLIESLFKFHFDR